MVEETEEAIKHLTSEELEAAIEAKTARVVCSKGGWRLVVHEGLKYSCVSSLVSMWAKPVGNKDSDYRGTKLIWTIKQVDPDTGYGRKPAHRRAIPINQLIPQLKQAISCATNGRWDKLDWPLLRPENIQVLIEEVEKAGAAKAA